MRGWPDTVPATPFAARRFTEPDASAAAWYALAVLVIAVFLANMDLQIFVLNIEPVRRALSMSDTQIGLLQGLGIAVFAGIASYPISWLADRYDRRVILVCCVVAWSIAAGARGVAATFEQLFVLSMFMGAGEAGLSPVVGGLIPDLFRGDKRRVANSVFATVSILGSALGLLLCAALIHGVEAAHAHLPPWLRSFEPWRLIFFATALPGALVAALVMAIRLAHLPPQGTQPGAHRLAPPIKPYLVEHWRAMVGFFGGLGLVSLGIGAGLSWLVIIATRLYGATAEQVGRDAGSAMLVATVFGFAASILLARRAVRSMGPVGSVRVIWLGTLAAAAASVALLVTTTLTQLYVVVGCTFAMIMVASTLLPTVLQDMSPRMLRSRVVALGGLALIGGKAIGPVIVGALSDALAGSSNALVVAVSVVATIGYSAGSLVLWRSEPAMRRAMDAAHAR